MCAGGGAAGAGLLRVPVVKGRQEGPEAGRARRLRPVQGVGNCCCGRPCQQSLVGASVSWGLNHKGRRKQKW